MPFEERSAGFVIYRPISGQAYERVYLLLDYGRHWDYPKGHVERGETDEAAALRELREETGIIDVRIIPGFMHEISYFFQHKKRGLIRKSVVFYLGRTEALDIRLSHEHVGYAFIPYDEAIARLTFSSARQVLQMAENFLLHRGRDSLS